MNQPPLSPVALFAFRRPWHTERVLDSLQSNSLAAGTDLTIFIDGPRYASDLEEVARVRSLASETKGFRSLRVVASDVNLGLARSLIGGINQILEASDRVVVIEDDIVVSPWFLDYMNEQLETYADDGRVASIHGYVYPHSRRLPDTFFIRGADCWGWGTWRRAWSVFDPDGVHLLAELRRQNLIGVLDFEGTAPYEDMLIDQIAGRNDSWAVRWYASALLNGMLTLYPNQPMAINIGEDNSGSHGGASRAYIQELAPGPIPIKRIPTVESPEGRDAFREFFRSRYRMPAGRMSRWAWRRARRMRARLRR